MSVRTAKVGIGAALVTMPALGHAHLVNSGLGPFYDGALHLLLSPADVLGLVAATLLAAPAPAVHDRPPVAVVQSPEEQAVVDRTVRRHAHAPDR